jgi:hypothetical protein
MREGKFTSGTSPQTFPEPSHLFNAETRIKRRDTEIKQKKLLLRVLRISALNPVPASRNYLGSMTSSGSGMITLVSGGTERVNQTLPPMTDPSPIVVSPPRIVAPE